MIREEIKTLIENILKSPENWIFVSSEPLEIKRGQNSKPHPVLTSDSIIVRYDYPHSIELTKEESNLVNQTFTKEKVKNILLYKKNKSQNLLLEELREQISEIENETEEFYYERIIDHINEY